MLLATMVRLDRSTTPHTTVSCKVNSVDDAIHNVRRCYHLERVCDERMRMVERCEEEWLYTDTCLPTLRHSTWTAASDVTE